ncbi:hypothetical protein IRZ71_16290 [Flavobacterium sp. ANB]|uniref:hypothetical protein n=1 Tax=unclassified Flavobacterium TaxID=196869 RepID=UPI0012B85F13|nr:MULTISPECIES: hypothetical protein [unclassified Flavobacterium]MBF4517927.1 hypothetical protein [Flavobacterium sp. ANB]MTD71329.1 hypothetical protein [Flavobacterium sp. LC2016-13]
MKYLKIIIFFFFFGCIKIFACDCYSPKPILEFYSSKYVFEGLVVNKKFTKDSATYTIKVKVLKSYKRGSIPKELSFTFYYKKENSVWSSCYSEVYKNQKLLVFASEYKGNLGFDTMCSNSQVIREDGINPVLQKVLDHGNEFKLEDYIYGNESDVKYEFNIPKPITNIDSIFKYEKAWKSDKSFGLFALFINKKGELESVFNFLDWNYSYGEFKFDPFFGLLKDFHVKSKRPLTDFEIHTIELLKKVKVWELKRNNKSQIIVDYMTFIYVEFDEKKMEWFYELR